jgi:hypothetical protein
MKEENGKNNKLKCKHENYREKERVEEKAYARRQNKAGKGKVQSKSCLLQRET